MSYKNLCVEASKVTLKDVTPEDFDFAFEAKRQAMGPHIVEKWGWDEEFQRSLHEQRWSEKPWFILERDNEKIGTLSLHKIDDKTIRFGEFYLLDEYRNQGIGTGVLTEILKDCDEKGLRVILEYLHWNPVGSLYKRHGFKITSENDIHYFMERKANA